MRASPGSPSMLPPAGFDNSTFSTESAVARYEAKYGPRPGRRDGRRCRLPGWGRQGDRRRDHLGTTSKQLAGFSGDHRGGSGLRKEHGALHAEESSSSGGWTGQFCQLSEKACMDDRTARARVARRRCPGSYYLAGRAFAALPPMRPRGWIEKRLKYGHRGRNGRVDSDQCQSHSSSFFCCSAEDPGCHGDRDEHSRFTRHVGRGCKGSLRARRPIFAGTVSSLSERATHAL